VRWRSRRERVWPRIGKHALFPANARTRTATIARNDVVLPSRRQQGIIKEPVESAGGKRTLELKAGAGESEKNGATMTETGQLERVGAVCGVILIGLAPWLVCARTAFAQTRNELTETPGINLRLPAGTILPAKLEHGLSSKTSRARQVVALRVMQSIPLPYGGNIPAGSHVLGSVVAATPATSRGGGELTLRFDELEVHHRRIAITTNLRVIASLAEVQAAEVPEVSIGFGTSYNWATTHQIGGDVKYGMDGPVTDRESHEVGRGQYVGVLARARANSDGGCQGAPDEDWLQALWVFSSDACGVYGLEQVEIAHAGRDEPIGTIILKAKRGDVKLRGGTALLLRALAAGADAEKK
jgi:hypothetical protein